MKQVTLVAFYGQKRGNLEQLIQKCLKMINDSKLRRIFAPYHVSQIHGTIVGMEKLIGFDNLFNANISKASGEKVIMKYDKFLKIITQKIPITIRLGGFNENYRGFMSFGKTAYERSFQVQWAASKFTLIGWPHKNNNFTNEIWDLRKELKTRCNIKHKYENDNDFFMVLGEIDGLQLLTDSELMELKSESASVEESIRRYLRLNPIDVEITGEQVFLAQYDKETLSLDSTNVYCIQNSSLYGDFIAKLYSN